MARPNSLGKTEVISFRIEYEMYEVLKQLAALETINTGVQVSVQELIRNAVKYTYGDNQHLRESFKKSRLHITKRIK